jgi:hypothetical protein
MGELNEFVEAALKYANMGLSVIPLHERSKKPMFNNWPEIATKDQSTISRWWASAPGANVGIVTGAKSGVFVFDVDTKNHGEIAYDGLLAEHGRFPETWQQVTGSGGFHLFFRYPAFPIKSRAGIFPGIDIRGDGGQVVAPPSIHPNGNRYEWDGLADINSSQVAEAPAWLLELLDDRDKSKQPLVIPEKIPHGVQHQTLVSLAGMMRRLGLTEQEIAPTLQTVNKTRCEKPGPTDNIDQIAHSMMRYRPNDSNLYSTSTKLWRMTRKIEADQERELQRLAVSPMDGLAVYRSQLPGPSMIVDRLLYNGLTILAGKSKLGKTFVGLQIALSVAMGTDVLNDRQVIRPGGVVYYSLEMGENRMGARMRSLLDVEHVTLQNLTFVWDCLPMAAGGIDQLALLLESKKPNLVVIDTFLAFVKGKGKEGGDVLRDQYAEIDTIKRLADKYETAILLIHHTKKAGKFESGAGVDLVAGSRGVTAACDAVWIFQKDPEGEVFSLEITGRDVEEQKLALQFRKEPLGWRIIGDMQNVLVANEERDALTILASDGALSPSKLGQRLKVGSIKAAEILVRLHKDGRVTKQSNGTFLALPEGREQAWSDR